ncbi:MULTISPECIES: hypothetical protein [unclassified Paenibacillus]|uniref:hypothetical protein n=1 Tax=unclassified Paenibacillus TaxID=185978 RepID=UPI00089735B7|nr:MULTISPECIES: hypothetical protein [unclassified Paenibacillus]OMC68467.1 hypothetical protein BK126_11565 [Paenibacillus sp. FSL H7-0326]SDW61154.1 hypothetical protein SAMN05518848_102385 [Paenibacillus sp. PDC88]
MKKWISSKRLLMVMMAFTLIFSTVAIPDNADARRGGGGFKSGTKSYTNTPNRSNDSNSNVSNSTTNRNNNATNSTTNQNRGFFSGGSLMKGLMIGGLAGMLFGGLFGGMGFFGELLGLAINLLAIFVLISLGVGIYRAIKRRREEKEKSRNIYDGNGRY